jgi:N-acetyl-1-D-myo-inositol-2-amino-2-deoxy-alpha-D-glucopyranoside deacetylase
MAQPDLRLLLVHAHPDDEVIACGIAMARYADEGVGVTLVTCTLGEEGEVLIPDLAHLAADAQDSLGEHRITELAEAMRIIGVTDHRFLGAPGRYRDSGMVFSDRGYAAPRTEIRPDSFWRADLLDAASDLVEVIREVRPQVVVTADEFGNYGHPDHIQAHRVTTYAVALAAVAAYSPDLGDAWRVSKVYWTANSESELRSAIRQLRAAGDTTTFEGVDPEGEMPFRALPDDLLTTRIHAPELAARKANAMRAHASQISPDGEFFAGGDEWWATEWYVLAAGTVGPPGADSIWEDDLFAGLR